MIYRHSSHLSDTVERAARVIIGVKDVKTRRCARCIIFSSLPHYDAVHTCGDDGFNSKRFEPCCGSLGCLLACRWCYGPECATPRVYGVDVPMTRRKGTHNS